MADFKANGNEIIECGNEIISLVDEYIAQINTLFSSLSKINKNGWSGNAADSFVYSLVMDKKRFIDFGDYLRMYGKVIKNTGDNVNRIIAKWDDE